MLSVPLQVQLTGASGTVVVSGRLLDDLSFSSSVPGGFRSAALTLAQKLSAYKDYTDAFAKVRIVDTRNGKTVWQGRLDLPGRSSGSGGETVSITATGPSSHAKDIPKPVLYVDTQLGSWVMGAVSPPSLQFQQLDNASVGGVGGRLQYAFPRGTAVVTNSAVGVRHYGLMQTGQKVARLNHVAETGASTNAAFAIQLIGRPGSGIAGEAAAAATWLSTTMSTAIVAFGVRLGSGLTGNYYIAEVRAIYTGVGGTVGDDVTNFVTTAPVIQGTRYDQSGAEILSGYTTDTVQQREVVIDALTRFCPQYDAALATISSAATTAFSQLYYPDGVTADDLFDDLMAIDPAFYWAAWEDTANGKARFEWSPWPTAVSYYADARDGSFSSPGSAADLYNWVTVRWKDDRGIIRATVASQSVPQLTALGLTRMARIDLGSEIGSASQATAAALSFLAAHKQVSNNGTLTVSKPIVDYSTGRTLQPWEIVPGKLISVRNILPRLGGLNPTASDAVSTFLVSEVTYSAKTNTATLTLDSYSDTVAKALAKLLARQRKLMRA